MSSQKNDLRILFITRKYPPSKGGLERVAYELHKHLAPKAQVKLIKYGGSNKFLPIILPLHFLRASWALLFSKFDVIYAQDCVLASLALVLKKVFGVPVVITANGLDLTFKSRFYQFLLSRSLPKLDKVICISEATKQLAESKVPPKTKLETIVYAVSDDHFEEDIQASWAALPPELYKKLKDKQILFTNGRLVERKGVAWFLQNVLPTLTKQYPKLHYVISGKGKNRLVIEDIITKLNLVQRVTLLGSTNEQLLRALYNIEDIFVMPNIPIKGDREGLGVVALEAASCGKPVVASKLEGICDAIKHRENGLLVAPEDAQAYIHTLSDLLDSAEKRVRLGKKARQYTLKHFSWDQTADAYLVAFRAVQKHR